MPKLIFEADMEDKDVRSDDGGLALIWEPEFEIEDGDLPLDPENGTQIEFSSWDDHRDHRSFRRFIGKRVRITVEVTNVLDRLSEISDADAEDIELMLAKWDDLADLTDVGLKALRNVISEELRRRHEQSQPDE